MKLAFEGADINSDGTLSINEFTALLAQLEPDKWTGDKVALFFRHADKDGSGSVNFAELMRWIFPPREKKEQKEGAPPEHADDDDSATSDSSSESDEEQAEVKAILRRKLSPAKKMSKNTDVTLLNEEELYTFLTLVDGRTGSSLKLQSLLDYFHLCKSAGMGPRLAGLASHNRKGEVPEGSEPEDVSPLELGKLFQLVVNDRKTTVEDARLEIEHVKEECRTLCAQNGDLESLLEAAGLDGETVVGFGVFKQLISLLVPIMCISRNNLVSCFTWARSGIYQLTESLAIEVLEKLLLKVPKDGKDVLSARVTMNDFQTMLYGLDLVAAPGKPGIQMGQIALTYGDVLKHMGFHLAERTNLRTIATGGVVKGRERKHNHRHITGRSQLSILMDGLYEALPLPKKYTCTLDMMLGFLANPPTPASPGAKRKAKKKSAAA